MRLIVFLFVLWLAWSLLRMRDRRVFLVIPSGGTAQPSGGTAYNPFDSISGIKPDPSAPVYKVDKACCGCK